MKSTFLLSVTLILFCLPALANTYYFSQLRGDDSRTTTQAQSSSTPWKTLNKLNIFFTSLKAGDSVLFEKGNVYYGKINIIRSGSSTDPIVFAAFGTGADPIITGFVTLSGWVSAGTNIWKASCTGCGTRVNMVSIGDSIQPMGRTPNAYTANSGYDSVQSHVGTTSITNTKLAAGPNWTGADLVIRKNRWTTERDSILLHSGNTINYSSTSTVEATNKFGYFIQNHISTLDKPGEWFYDAKTKMMNMYWAGAAPAVTIQASALDTLVNLSNIQYIVFNGLVFEGSNKAGFNFFNSSYVTITNCKIRHSGQDGIKAVRSNNLTIANSTVEYTNNNGIDLDGSRNTIQDSKILKTGSIPGMGCASHSYQGVTFNGDNNTIQNCIIDSCGFNGIVFMGASTTIKNNLVTNFCFVKEDGGGIYTWAGDIDSSTRRVMGWLTGNIVLNGITACDGTDRAYAGIAIGIYLDENSNTGTITGNTVAHCTSGLFIQDAHEITVSGNTLYDNGGQIVLRHFQTNGAFKNNDINTNIAVSKTDSQNVLVMSSPFASNVTSWAYFHANKYAQVSQFSNFFYMSFPTINLYGSLGLWKSMYQQDWNSTQLALNFSPYTVNQLLGSNLFPKASLVTPFQQAAAGTRVVVNTPVGAILSGTWYVTHFTLHSPDDQRSLMVYLQKYQPPYTHFAPVITVPASSPSSNQTLVFYSTGADPSSSMVFQMNQSDPRVYIDKIDLYRASVTPNDVNQNVIFQYNASKAAVSLPLSGIYQDAGGVTYQNTIQIQPYASVVLFKK